jgi:uncharacterized DUF497 family protein
VHGPRIRHRGGSTGAVSDSTLGSASNQRLDESADEVAGERSPNVSSSSRVACAFAPKAESRNSRRPGIRPACGLRYTSLLGDQFLMEYNFQWDPAKARSNREKHGVAFEEAATVFRDPRALTVYDPDHSESEDRWVTLGISGSGRLLVVCHTYKEEPDEAAAIRIYSARRPTPAETRSYEEA